ncbi:hypothetical protein C7212DRAFT_343059 [Tuber magnatum]|uniref:DUF7492 domain-containing protein n=1 Tax=Tuber magnatum TaxID=42249 RepID=A0A317SUZ4_9PEZI|nr:hypothetical protein C7212DRAFT_343059 [Tuber magnatum]
MFWKVLQKVLVEGMVVCTRGGKERGNLFLAVAPFDDGICIEANETPISKGRGGLNIPCHSAFTIPWDVQPSSIYTVYWIWDYLVAKHIDVYPPLDAYIQCTNTNG